MTDRLPSLRPRDVIRALQRAGFVVARTSGSHCRLIHQSDASRKVTVPIHNEDLKRGTLRGGSSATAQQLQQLRLSNGSNGEYGR
jgi:predicted RNA binding protein YcfA (HicA-like mRNA interferase family)